MSTTNKFYWGCATASYQIEGKLPGDGRGDCVWDMFCRQPGKVRLDHSGAIACHHLQHRDQDVALMADLGLSAYRFSVSWPRVIPSGTGSINPQGLGFYDELVDRLLDNHIEPWVTLFHWDYPYQLFLKGGWLNPDSPKWFADYAQVVVDRLSDRVGHWITLNEPQCFIHFGHQSGYHAPGLELCLREVLTAGHHSLIAHGLACQVIRSSAQRSPIIGAAPVGNITIPAQQTPECIAAAESATFAITERNAWNNTWFSDPMILGHYPQDGLLLFGKDVPQFDDKDFDTICQPLDFYGTNIYTADLLAMDEMGTPEQVNPPPGSAYSAMDWLVVPECLYWASKYFHTRYNLPLVFTENGMACHDWVDSDGKVHDPQRIDYLRTHIEQVLKAQNEGIPTKGYFVWSFLDNFEWALGYDRRFGIVHVDYQTQKRTPKSSYTWYRDFIQHQDR